MSFIPCLVGKRVKYSEIYGEDYGWFFYSKQIELVLTTSVHE